MDREPRKSRTPSHAGHGRSPESPAKAAGCARGFSMAAAVLGSVLVLTGCTTISDMAESAKCAVQDWTRPKEASQVHLDRQKSVFIALPADAQSPCASYVGSGDCVAHAMARAFARRGIPVEVAKKRLTNDEAVSLAARTNSGYVVLPVITRWEQRNTWLGQPSRLALWVSVIETASGKVVVAEPVKSCSIQPVSFTVESPETLLERPLSRYVNNLY
jgi:hypothetical protein